MNLIYFGLLFVFLVKIGFGFKINITKFENCQDLPLMPDEILPVELLNIEYENLNGFVDTIHGNYIIRTVDTREKELLITIFQCATNSIGSCNDHPKQFIERLHCERFNGDQSGPWYMLSSAMTGSKCGETKGTFSLDNAKLRPEYIKNYINDDKNLTKYRLKMLFHKKGEAIDDIHIRGCVNMEFDIFY